jgi:TolB protein
MGKDLGQQRLSDLKTARRALGRCLAVVGVLAMSGGFGPARAQLDIQIVGGGANQIPVSIAPFEGELATPVELSAVIAADLQRSGRFRLVEAPAVRGLSIDSGAIDPSGLRGRGIDAIAAGAVRPEGGGRHDVRFRLFDAARGEQLTSGAYGARTGQLRTIAHRVADAIYEKMTGERGVFATRIAYVVKIGNRYELQVADADGANASPVLISDEPILSPTWSPDGSALAYVSLQAKKPIVYVQRLAERRQVAVAGFKGSNSAPAWAPDGKRLAVVLTRDGGSQLFMINADGSGVRRLATSSGIDTEPTFSADGQWLYFTSDRGGAPQIYRMPAGGGDAQRLTFEGSYNVSPAVSADGRTLAYITRAPGGQFRLAVLDIETRQVQMLTETTRDESPSFAPNGKMILYATEVGGRGTLAAVSVDGRFRQRLSVTAAEVREPAWGPFLP